MKTGQQFCSLTSLRNVLWVSSSNRISSFITITSPVSRCVTCVGTPRHRDSVPTEALLSASLEGGPSPTPELRGRRTHGLKLFTGISGDAPHPRGAGLIDSLIDEATGP